MPEVVLKCLQGQKLAHLTNEFNATLAEKTQKFQMQIAAVQANAYLIKNAFRVALFDLIGTAKEIQCCALQISHDLSVSSDRATALNSEVQYLKLALQQSKAEINYFQEQMASREVCIRDMRSGISDLTEQTCREQSLLTQNGKAHAAQAAALAAMIAALRRSLCRFDVGEVPNTVGSELRSPLLAAELRHGDMRRAQNHPDRWSEPANSSFNDRSPLSSVPSLSCADESNVIHPASDEILGSTRTNDITRHDLRNTFSPTSSDMSSRVLHSQTLFPIEPAASALSIEGHNQAATGLNEASTSSWDERFTAAV